MQEAAECIVACLPSWAPRDQKRHHPPVALVGSKVGCAQPVLFVHRPQYYVEGHERHEDRAVRRHVRQEQKESQITEVTWVATEEERSCFYHLDVEDDRWT